MENQPAVVNNFSVGTNRLVLDDSSFASIMKFAQMMAGGVSTVPKHLQKNQSDCAAVIMQAMQWQMNPYAVAQKTHLVNGVLGYEAQLVNAVLNSRAPIKSRLNYDWFGPWEKIQGKLKQVTSQTKKDDNGQPKTYMVPDWKAEDEKGIGIKVFATLEGEDKPRELTVMMSQARTRNSTLWAEDPKQQIAYLATKKWARLYCPDVILGVYTPDELDDIERTEKDVTPRGSVETAPAKEAEPLIDVNAVLEAIAKHTSNDELKSAWKAWAAQCEKEANLTAYNIIKQAVTERALDIKAEEKPKAEQQDDLPLEGDNQNA